MTIFLPKYISYPFYLNLALYNQKRSRATYEGMQVKTATKPWCTKPSSGISFGGFQLKFKLLNFSQMSRNKKTVVLCLRKGPIRVWFPKGLFTPPKLFCCWAIGIKDRSKNEPFDSLTFLISFFSFYLEKKLEDCLFYSICPWNPRKPATSCEKQTYLSQM